MSRLKNLASLLTRPRPPVGTTPADVVHRENKWRLLRYRANPNAPRRFDTPILLVPSLINRHYVMDLLPGKSMAEDLVAMGHDVYCIDWGTPGDEDRFVTFDDVCDTYLGRAIRKVAKTSPRGKTHVLGYCLGGTLAVIHAAARPEHVASLLVLAAPVSFADAGPMAVWTRSPQFKVGAIVEGFGNVPWQLMQGAFHMLRPTLNLAKAVGVIDRAANDEFLDGFLAIETWGNDNVSFPGACYERYIEELYRNDALMNGTFTLSATPARMENITCPTMCVVFGADNIVPAHSASVLVDRISSQDKTLLELPGGHVGAVVSKAAKKNLWPKMSAYWAARDADPKPIVVEPEPEPVPVTKASPRSKARAKPAPSTKTPSRRKPRAQSLRG
ncbi:MAG: alpha/beta fold hydrolase [Labilithrix sp.]|nr:alpha/beta fold hydrolase [Labilithrix sp.]MCW5811381.1 alpha/beta fold hydrolase [Labilithrix sp.]